MKLLTLYCIINIEKYAIFFSSERNNKMKISEIKVLICDDSILVRKKLNQTLKEMGITEIREAVNGNQAVEFYKEINPDVTFMDIVMPEKSGLDALKEIKEYNPDARVIMASTIGTQSNLTTAIKAGATDFLQKPVNNEDVYKIINSLLK